MYSHTHEAAVERPVAPKEASADFRAAARVMKAVAEPVRLAILHHLRDGERCVCDIARLVGAERSNVSRHLSILAGAGVVSGRKQGLMVFYSLRTPCILNVFTCVHGVLQAELERGQQAMCCLSPAEATR